MVGVMAMWSGLAHGADAGDLLTRIDHLDVVGSVLYVAAHPDDENTRLIHWLGQARGLRAAYLSMTRGGGGQNLIGAEQAERLSVVRTGELLAARAIDGGEQLFTRMRDFGYSKSPEETLRLWGHEEALADVVRAIRTFRPDIVVTRFSAEGGGHGHHTASAQLAAEAFERAADPAYALDGLDVWQASRLLRNESTWRRPKDAPIPDDWLRVDVGTYDPRVGASSGEVAARARSQHKSQGFGSAPRIGPIDEYFTVTAGQPVDDGDPFGGVDLSWSRWPEGRRIAARVDRIRRRFDPREPEAILPLLAELHEALEELTDPHWRARMRSEVEALMRACAGVYVTARTSTVAAAPGEETTLTLTALVRRPATVDVVGVTGPAWAARLPAWTARLQSTVETLEAPLTVASTAPFSQPHWLVASPEPTRYRVDVAGDRLLPNRPPAAVRVRLGIQGVQQDIEVAIAQSTTDPVRGEVVRPFEVLPRVTATFDAPGVLVPRGGRVEVPMTLAAPTLTVDDEPIEVAWTLDAPSGVTVATEPATVTLGGASPQQSVTLRIAAAQDAVRGPVTVAIGSQPAHQRHRIDYPHLPERTVLAPASLAVTQVDLRRGRASRIGYLPGSGDAVPDALRSVGYDVVLVDEAQLADLSSFDAVVFGVRAYNTRPGLVAWQPALLDYVAQGGTLVVQYNTSRRWSTLSERIGPAPLTVGRGRVTDETAEMRFVEPEHPLMRSPNRLGAADFDGWVQERGLYFVEEWDEAYTPLFETQDPGEEPQQGALLVTKHGRGTFVYTGLSFFRQLPAGVPGAMRLFANLLAGGR
ncbi:MAG: PIG-L family deacetylase [Myxococcota bacterium]